MTDIAYAYGKLYSKVESIVRRKGTEFDLRVALRDVLVEVLNIHDDYVSFEKSKTDMIILDVIVETKNYGLLHRQYDYARENLKQKMKRLNLPYGVLIDFKEVEIYKQNEESIHLQHKGEFNLDAFQNIVSLIQSRQDIDVEKLLSERRLSIDFGNPQPIISLLYAILKEAIPKLGKTSLLYNEWLKLFKLSEITHEQYIRLRRQALERIFKVEVNDSNEYKLLFCLHTYIAIVVKFLTYNYLSRLKKFPRKSKFQNIKEMKDFCFSIESGELFKMLGVVNFCQFDFFMWYVEEPWTEEFFKELNLLYQKAICYTHNIREAKEGFTFADTIKSFYESTVPREIRHSFGEYYTPSFIANFMVRETVKNLPDDYKAVDPTCGSGTFLVSLLVDKILRLKITDPWVLRSQVVGMDLNPIAVLLARFNYLLTILHLLNADLVDYEIPVYIGDASYTPTIREVDGIKCIEYEYYFPQESKVDFGTIVFPLDFVKDDRFSLAIGEVERMVLEGRPCEEIKKFFVEEIRQVCATLPTSLEDRIRALIQKAVDYHKQNLNTIWLFIFMNYLKTFALAPFDLVIGNPPWVRWAVLPEEYRNKIKSKLRVEGVFSRDTNYGGVDLNICALITHRAVDTLVKDNGYLVFIFPKGVLKNKSYEGFRNWTYNSKRAKPVRLYIPKKSFFKGEEPVILVLQTYS